MKKEEILKISGMTCINCQNRIEKALKKEKGIIKASVSYDTRMAKITFDDEIISLDEIKRIIADEGYGIGRDENSVSRRMSLLILIFALFMFLQNSGILNTLTPGKLADSNASYGMLFLIGLLTSVHCIAMCGGINLSQCIGHTEHSFRSAFLYNSGRVISYTLIGGILGLIGSFAGGSECIGLPVIFQGMLKLVAGILMILMGINMLNLFPGIRGLMPRIPKKIALSVQKRKVGSGAFVVGILNGLMPCGPLQAMQIVALASGDPFQGALSMFMFSLGTVPLMLGLGSVVSMLGKKFAGKVMTAGSVLVVVLGMAMFLQGKNLIGTPYMSVVQSVDASNAAENNTENTTADVESNGEVQEIHSTLTGGRYPNITVTAGVPVKWVIDVPKNVLNGCNYKMLLNAYGIEHTFTEGENIIEFTPTKTGEVSYTCWMGMIRGDILVTDASGNTETEGSSEENSNEFFGGSCCG